MSEATARLMEARAAGFCAEQGAPAVLLRPTLSPRRPRAHASSSEDSSSWDDAASASEATDVAPSGSSAAAGGSPGPARIVVNFPHPDEYTSTPQPPPSPLRSSCRAAAAMPTAATAATRGLLGGDAVEVAGWASPAAPHSLLPAAPRYLEVLDLSAHHLTADGNLDSRALHLPYVEKCSEYLDSEYMMNQTKHQDHSDENGSMMDPNAHAEEAVDAQPQEAVDAHPEPPLDTSHPISTTRGADGGTAGTSVHVRSLSAFRAHFALHMAHSPTCVETTHHIYIYIYDDSSRFLFLLAPPPPLSHVICSA